MYIVSHLSTKLWNRHLYLFFIYLLDSNKMRKKCITKNITDNRTARLNSDALTGTLEMEHIKLYNKHNTHVEPRTEIGTTNTVKQNTPTHLTLTQAFLTFKSLLNRSLSGWLLIVLLLIPLRLNSCSSDSKKQFAKIHNSSLDTPHSARNLGCIRPYLYSLTASTIATSAVHSELDYCNYH